MNDRVSFLPNFLNLELGEFVSTTVRGSSDFRFFVFFPCAATSIFAILSAAARGDIEAILLLMKICVLYFSCQIV